MLHNSINSLFLMIGERLEKNENVEIDLAEYGKIQSINRQIMYAPLNKLKPGGFQGK